MNNRLLIFILLPPLKISLLLNFSPLPPKVPVHQILERFPLGPGLWIRGSPPHVGTPLGSGAVGSPPESL